MMTTDAAARHDRESIITAALAILDAQGLADLTMRRLAEALGVRASALYWHFENKQALLAAVADRIVAEAASANSARALRDALLAHRDGAEVVLSTQALSLGEDAPRRILTTGLTDTPDPERAAAILLPYVLGHASIVQQRLQAAELGVITRSAKAIRADADAEFDTGVSAILAGLRRE
ncbi:MAG: TetR family transcriptional regulator [Microbacterium sp.]